MWHDPIYPSRPVCERVPISERALDNYRMSEPVERLKEFGVLRQQGQEPESLMLLLKKELKRKS